MLSDWSPHVYSDEPWAETMHCYQVRPRPEEGPFYYQGFDLNPHALTYEELDRRCESIFERWDQKLMMEKKLLRKRPTWVQGAPIVRVKIEAGQAPGQHPKKKRRRSPRSRLPHENHSYVHELRAELNGTYDGCDPAKLNGWNWSANHQHIERALVHLLFVDGHFKMVKGALEKIIDSGRPTNWTLGWFGEGNQIWYEALYHLLDPQKCREKLTPVRTFRIRQKYPSPLQKSVGRSKYNIPDMAANLLRSFYQEVSDRPSKDEKRRLSAKTGLSFDTITNWFKNRRQRKLKAPLPPNEENSPRVSQSSSGYSSDDYTLKICVGPSDIYAEFDHIIAEGLNLYNNNLHQQEDIYCVP